VTLTHEAIRDGAEVFREQHRHMRRTRPAVSLYHNDGSPGLYLRGRLGDNISGDFPVKKNNFGNTGEIVIPIQHHLARWLVSIRDDPAAKKNVVIRVDHMGGHFRWTGIMKFAQGVKRNGVWFLRVVFISDEQYMQFMLGPPNPLLPIPIFQFPRVFPLFGPAKWAISMMILLQLIRIEGNLWTLPDDPFDLGSWADSFNPATWQVLIKADAFPLDDSSTWNILATRMNRMDTVIQDALDDAKLVFTCRRVFSDEGETIEGGAMGVTVPANGALVIEIKQRDGYYSDDGTATGGGIIGGFVRTVQGFAEGFVEDVSTFTGNPTSWSSEYYDPDYRGPWSPSRPGVLVRDNKYSNVESAEFTWSPATATSVIVGGDNPYADMLAELLIESIGNILGYFLLGGFDSAGSIAATVIMPFLVGTILAWLQWENGGRATSLGWVHLWEIYQQGAENNAWSLSAISALRAGFLSTKAEGSHTFSMGSGGRWLPGLHFEIGSRIGSTFEQLSDLVWMDQVEEINLSWDYSSDKPHEYVVKVGLAKAAMSTAERQARLINKALTTLQNVGVHLIS